MRWFYGLSNPSDLPVTSLCQGRAQFIELFKILLSPSLTKEGVGVDLLTSLLHQHLLDFVSVDNRDEIFVIQLERNQEMKSCTDSSCTASKEFERIFEWMIGPVIISNMRNFQFELCIEQSIICHIAWKVDNISSRKLLNKTFNLMNMSERMWFFIKIDEDSLVCMCLGMNGFKNRMTKIMICHGMICPTLSYSKWGFFSGYYCFCSWQKITIEEFSCRFLRISNSSKKNKIFADNCRSKQKE